LWLGRWGKLETKMLKLVTQAMLKGAQGLASGLIATGERLAAAAERWGADEAYDLSAPYAEIWMHNRAENVAAMVEWVDGLTDRLHLKLCR
jgi:hypothetical protein